MQRRDFKMTVQGRLLSHLGVQLYQTRPAAIAELVANAWDACATVCMVTIPPDAAAYAFQGASVTVDDDGVGMAVDEVEAKYLKLSRNRRIEDSGRVTRKYRKKTISREVLGRKGIGKLAGFGIARTVRVQTWRPGESIEFTMDSALLEMPNGQSGTVRIPGKIGVPAPDLGFVAGTRVTLENLYAATPLDPAKLRESLGRRFGRKVLGEMIITVNGEPIQDPPEWNDLNYREPDEDFDEVTLGDGNSIRYWMGFTEHTIKPLDSSGITVLVRGKVAQSTPFYFFAESGTRQFNFRYLTGVVEADFLDAGINETPEEADVISTDRQKIRWDHERVEALREWGERTVRRMVMEWDGPTGTEVVDLLKTDQGFADRVGKLDTTERAKIQRMAKIIAASETPDARASELMDTVIRAFEFRQFYDVISDIESRSDDPDQFVNLVQNLRSWQVLESRALLEIVSGRLKIIDKFEKMLVTNAPERAGKIGAESLHDLLADQPWLLNPEYVVLAEEKKLRNTLLENEGIKKSDGRRVDFLGLAWGTERLVVIEIKAPGHAVELDEMQRLVGYLSTYRQAKFDDVFGVLVANEFNVDRKTLSDMKKLFKVRRWKDIFNSARKYLEHYRGILELDPDSPSFESRAKEIERLRRTIEVGAVRGTDRSLGQQDTTVSVPKGIVIPQPKKVATKGAPGLAGKRSSKAKAAKKKRKGV